MALKNRLYPHLLPVDIPVWEKFLQLHPDLYTHIDYDVRVGVGRDPGETYDPTIRTMALDLSMRRIDAVGHTPTELHIIEITRHADLKCLGQLRAYPQLYEQTFGLGKPLRAVLVCQTIGTDLADIYATSPIHLHIVNPDAE